MIVGDIVIEQIGKLPTSLEPSAVLTQPAHLSPARSLPSAVGLLNRLPLFGFG